MQYIWTLFLLLQVVPAEALQPPEVCYVLDAILFVYGIVLTALYCRLKLQMRKKESAAAQGSDYEEIRAHQKDIYLGINPGKMESRKEMPKEEGIYTGLEGRQLDTYESLQPQKFKKPQ
ncbi:high affinity immunoglobulin epsilon receptor subunit gamma-like [Scyliorhinus canicula]|uniref:high affinity immunoglobulin epsilon receptor subunit gamma-like n=1 Tax=Scyliorhinus canicula TaxID=7830 RepID=UPI0018F2DA94|nr:high affinity immunoglobulin epsilon receptor subunit gamma-like [Scyliorhinus canicula]